MAEQPPPKRRIVKWFVRTLAIVVLVPVLYLTSYLSFHFAWGTGLVPPPVSESLTDGFYAPFDWYIGEHYPGARAILALRNMAGEAGNAIGSRIEAVSKPIPRLGGRGWSNAKPRRSCTGASLRSSPGHPKNGFETASSKVSQRPESRRPNNFGLN